MALRAYLISSSLSFIPNLFIANIRQSIDISPVLFLLSAIIFEFKFGLKSYYVLNIFYDDFCLFLIVIKIIIIFWSLLTIR